MRSGHGLASLSDRTPATNTEVLRGTDVLVMMNLSEGKLHGVREVRSARDQYDKQFWLSASVAYLFKCSITP